MGGLRASRALVVAIVAIGGVSIGSVTARPAAAAETSWQRPVPGTLVRGFVEPSGEYAPGHRGVDLAAAPGTPVRAAGPGSVVFAGDVAGALHVVVAHRNGVRTSYSFLLDIAVSEGETVTAGAVVGHAGGADPDSGHASQTVHFGVRIGDRYIDPLLLFQARDLTELVRLVPVQQPVNSDPSWGHSTTDEVTALRRGLPPPPSVVPVLPSDDGCSGGVPLIGGAIDAVCDAVEWGAGRTRDALTAGLHLLEGGGELGAQLARRLEQPLNDLLDGVAVAAADLRARLLNTPLGLILRDLVEMGERFLEWTQRECSNDDPPADGTGGSGHLLMAVAGIDTSSPGGGARSFGLDTAALGYDDGDVHWFSYAADGGAYTREDTYGDLKVAAHRLAGELRALHEREPGREVDLIAHSQGGIVVDVFLRREYDASDPTLPPIGTVVTLASPHRGAPLATYGAQLRSNPVARRVLDVTDAARPGPPSAAKSVQQLAETSHLMRHLWDDGLPDHIDFTTIGGTKDVVVPANRIGVPGATEVVIGLDALNDHSAITHDPHAMQAVRAALEQRPPPCTTLLEGLSSAIAPVFITHVEHHLDESVKALVAVATA